MVLRKCVLLTLSQFLYVPRLYGVLTCSSYRPGPVPTISWNTRRPWGPEHIIICFPSFFNTGMLQLSCKFQGDGSDSYSFGYYRAVSHLYFQCVWIKGYVFQHLGSENSWRGSCCRGKFGTQTWICQRNSGTIYQLQL